MLFVHLRLNTKTFSIGLRRVYDLVATEISKLGVFGTLPNTSRKTPQLLFQYSYQKFLKM